MTFVGIRVKLNELLTKFSQSYEFCIWARKALKSTSRKYIEIQISDTDLMLSRLPNEWHFDDMGAKLRIIYQCSSNKSLKDRINILYSYFNHSLFKLVNHITFQIRNSELMELTDERIGNYLGSWPYNLDLSVIPGPIKKISNNMLSAALLNQRISTIYFEPQTKKKTTDWFRNQIFLDLNNFTEIVQVNTSLCNCEDILEFNALVLIITEQCNISCRHCALGSSPHLSRPIDVKLFQNAIKDAAHLPNVRKECAFAGGEPTLYIDELECLMETAVTEGMSPSVTTNGWWGKTEETATTILSRLFNAGLRRMELSVDVFHQEFIPIKNIRTALHLAREHGISVILRVCVTREHHAGRALQWLDTNDLEGVLVAISHIIPIGRAKTQCPSNQNYYSKRAIFGNCRDFLNLTISPNGNVSPCCAGSDMIPFLSLGNFREKGLEIIMDQLRFNKVIQQLVRMGPASFFKALSKRTRTRILSQPSVNICHLCSLLFNDEDACDEIMKFAFSQLVMFVRHHLEVSNP